LSNVITVDTVGEGTHQMIVRDIEVTAGSSVLLSCRTSPLTDVVHAEWDFHRHYVGKPIRIYDGSGIDPEHDNKYDIRCNLSLSICDLRINRLEDSDTGQYQCYLVKDNTALKFIYRLTVIGKFKFMC